MYKTTRFFFSTLIALLVLFSTPAGTAFAGTGQMDGDGLICRGITNLKTILLKDIEEELGLGLVGSSVDNKINLLSIFSRLADRGPGYDTSRGDDKRFLKTFFTLHKH